MPFKEINADIMQGCKVIVIITIKIAITICMQVANISKN